MQNLSNKLQNPPDKKNTKFYYTKDNSDSYSEECLNTKKKKKF